MIVVMWGVQRDDGPRPLTLLLKTRQIIERTVPSSDGGRCSPSEKFSVYRDRSLTHNQAEP